MIEQKIVSRSLSITENSSLFANKVSPHNCVAYVDFDGYIDEKVFRLALHHALYTFPCLASRIVQRSKQDIQIIAVPGEIPFYQCTIHNEIEFNQFFEKEINSPFDLLDGSLIRVARINKGDKQRLIITMHHIICDGISLAYFVGFLFDTIELLLQGKQFNSRRFGNHKIEEFVDLSLIEKKINSCAQEINNLSATSLSEDQQIFPAYTKSITFSINKPNRNYYHGVGINYLILMAASLALKEFLLTDTKLKYIIPVNMRPYSLSPISNYELGFYSSWIEFYHSVLQNDDIELAKSLEKKTKAAIENKEQFRNLITLNESMRSHQPEGIIKNILSANNPSICMSNVGKIDIKTSYAEGSIQLKSMHLGLNSFFRADNCFLLIASSLNDDIQFSFLYASPFLSSEKANKIVDSFKAFF